MRMMNPLFSCPECRRNIPHTSEACKFCGAVITDMDRERYAKLVAEAKQKQQISDAVADAEKLPRALRRELMYSRILLFLIIVGVCVFFYIRTERLHERIDELEKSTDMAMKALAADHNSLVDKHNGLVRTLSRGY